MKRSPFELSLIGCYYSGDTLEIRSFVPGWNIFSSNRMTYPYNLTRLKENLKIKIYNKESAFTLSYSSQEFGDFDNKSILLYVRKFQSKGVDSLELQLYFLGMSKTVNFPEVVVLSKVKLPILQDITHISRHIDIIKAFEVIHGSSADTITFIDLTATGLKKIPKEIKNLKNLKHIGLSGNFLKDEDFSLLKDLRNLRILEISNCNLYNFPKNILEMKSLESIDLSRNMLDSIPETLFLKNIKFIDLRFNSGFHQLSFRPKPNNRTTIWLDCISSEKK